MFLKISEGLPGCSPLNCEISWQWQDLSQELQTSGILSKAINKTLLHKPDN